MFIRDFLPDLKLQNIVKTYHLSHYSYTTQSNVPIKSFSPRDEHYITFYIAGGETIQLTGDKTISVRNTATITGQFTQLITRQPTPHFLGIEVVFFPGVLFQLIEIPFYKLRNRWVELVCFFPKETREIKQKLQEARDYAQMIRFLNEFFIDLLINKAKNIDYHFEKVRHFMMDSQFMSKIDLLANQVCLSKRQLERLSMNYFGVSPKTMMRIMRFRSAKIMRSSHPELSWFEVALNCGYEDYQHMVRDFKEFTGITPKQLWEIELKIDEKIMAEDQ